MKRVTQNAWPATVVQQVVTARIFVPFFYFRDRLGCGAANSSKMLHRHARQNAMPKKRKSSNVLKVVLTTLALAAVLRTAPWALRKLGVGQVPDR